MFNNSKKIYSHLLQASKTIIIPHQNPDGDALGAAGALMEFMITNRLPAEIFCVTPISAKLKFIPHSHRISHQESTIFNSDVDTIVVLDSGDLRYAGVDQIVRRQHQARIINIDHHPTNEHYGHYNLVSSEAASTTEILYYFFKINNLFINHRMATALLTGLITDTDNFNNAATKTDTLRIASELVRTGGNLNLIHSHTIKNKNINTLKLWGLVLKRLEKHPELNIAHTYIQQSDFIKNNVDETESEGIANFLNRLEETPITLVLKETKNGKIKGSFRTTKDDVDVSQLAKIFAGGGHKKAAGFTADGTLQSVWEKFINTLKKK